MDDDCPFKELLPHSWESVYTAFGPAPKGSILSYKVKDFSLASGKTTGRMTCEHCKPCSLSSSASCGTATQVADHPDGSARRGAEGNSTKGKCRVEKWRQCTITASNLKRVVSCSTGHKGLLKSMSCLMEFPWTMSKL